MTLIIGKTRRYIHGKIQISIDQLSLVEVHEKASSGPGTASQCTQTAPLLTCHMHFVRTIKQDYKLQFIRTMIDIQDPDVCSFAIGGKCGILQTEYLTFPLYDKASSTRVSRLNPGTLL